MASISKLKEGQIVYSIMSQKMGNTTVSRKACFTVKVVEIDLEKKKVLASWNGNTPKWFYERSVKQWKVNKPEPKGTIFGLPSY